MTSIKPPMDWPLKDMFHCQRANCTYFDLFGTQFYQLHTIPSTYISFTG